MGMEQHLEEPFMTPEEKLFEAKQFAQIEIMSNMGLSTEQEMADWIQANGSRVDKLVRDAEFHFIERFNEPATHEAALEELKQKLYH